MYMFIRLPNVPFKISLAASPRVMFNSPVTSTLLSNLPLGCCKHFSPRCTTHQWCSTICSHKHPVTFCWAPNFSFCSCTAACSGANFALLGAKWRGCTSQVMGFSRTVLYWYWYWYARPSSAFAWLKNNKVAPVLFLLQQNPKPMG